MRPAPSRPWLALAGAAVLLVSLCPPLATAARGSEVVDAVQFGLLALLVPALLALGAPWARLGLARPAAWLAARRAAAAPLCGVAALVLQCAAVVGWRTPDAVGAIQSHHALVLLEAACLVVTGAALWTALVSSPPLRAVPPARRLVLATVAMWLVWIVAYVTGMAHGQGYPGFAHVPGHGLSAAASRQVATAVLFAAAAAAYLPVIFTSLFSWLAAEERRGAAETRRLGPGVRALSREEARPAR